MRGLSAPGQQREDVVRRARGRLTPIAAAERRRRAWPLQWGSDHPPMSRRARRRCKQATGVGSQRTLWRAPVTRSRPWRSGHRVARLFRRERHRGPAQGRAISDTSHDVTTCGYFFKAVLLSGSDLADARTLPEGADGTDGTAAQSSKELSANLLRPPPVPLRFASRLTSNGGRPW